MRFWFSAQPHGHVQAPRVWKTTTASARGGIPVQEIASGQEQLILQQSKAQGFWSSSELKTVSQHLSRCQMKLVELYALQLRSTKECYLLGQNTKCKC